MYSHVLVPLDGSSLAEQVLPHVRALPINKPDAYITLLMSVSPYEHPQLEHGESVFVHPTAPNTERQHAQRYLNEIAQHLQAEGYRVSIEISNRKAEDAIVEYAGLHNVDLIAIATHGRSGISRWLFGSVTQKVLQAAAVPVLVIRPRTGQVEMKEPVHK